MIMKSENLLRMWGTYNLYDQTKLLLYYGIILWSVSSSIDTCCPDNDLNISVKIFMQVYHKVLIHKMKAGIDFGGCDFSCLGIGAKNEPEMSIFSLSRIISWP